MVTNDFPESHDRNPALVEAMRNVKRVETEGGGIKKLFMQQRRRFFPMPDYDIEGNHVYRPSFINKYLFSSCRS